jgi:predicted O-methyltransferase YrrM
LGSPAPARHWEYSAIFSADDEPGRPSERLVDVALEAIRAARRISLSTLSARLPGPPYYPDIWPGEHYRLLAALVAVLAPSTVIEIGTATGLSALAMKATLPPGGRVTTFDIVPWRDYPGTVLTDADFTDGRLEQHVDDLTTTEAAARRLALLRSAALIFIDAAKDGVQEQRFIDNLLVTPFTAPPIVVFDDIRVWNMLRIWRELSLPKLDLTSFGHWSGTGLVDWSLSAEPG